MSEGATPGLVVPQGMTPKQFEQLSLLLRQWLSEVKERTGDLGHHIFVHGSRARGNAGPDADLDIGIRVDVEIFRELLHVRLARVSVGSDRWETLQAAQVQQRLHAGESGIGGVRRRVQQLVNEEMQLGFEKGVQLTVICAGGPFDQGPYIWLLGG